MKNKGLMLLIFFFLGAFLAFLNYNNETQRAISIKDKKIIIYQDNQIIEIDGGFIIDENGVYLDKDVILDNLNSHISYDEESKMLVITTLDEVIRFYGEETVKINQEETKDISPMIFIENKPFLPIDRLDAYLGLSINYIEDTNKLVLLNMYEDRVTGKIFRNNIKLFTDKSIFSSTIDTLFAEDSVIVVEEDKSWTKVITEGGYIGYVKSKHIIDKVNISGKEKKTKNPIWKPKNEKIILTWEHVYSKNPDTNRIGELKGVNIVSPTWLSLGNSEGKINSNISQEYISWAKDRGYRIWVLFSNSFDPDLTHEFLNNARAREYVINQLLDIVKENNMDGINIDFENVYLKDKRALVQFVRELTPIFHENRLVVSMDVTVKGGSENWSLFYDRAALGEVVDYIAVMTYDEHWAASPVSGSVASLSWVEKGIKGLLEEVPKEKLLLGIPFYTRMWVETPSRTKANEMDVKSRTLTMEAVNKILEKDNVVRVWDEMAGQEFLVYIEDGAIHKVWVEDSKSIELKTKLVNKYNLAGVAIWRRGFETENIWEVIDSTLNK